MTPDPSIEVADHLEELRSCISIVSRLAGSIADSDMQEEVTTMIGICHERLDRATTILAQIRSERGRYGNGSARH
jgi:hypothetical protein